MSVAPLSNSFETGLADGALITPANSGGDAGDAFDTTTQNATQGPFYSNVHAHRGNLSMKVISASGNRICAWTGLGAITTSVWIRLYLFLTALPTTNNLIIARFANTGATGTNSFLTVRTDGKVHMTIQASQTGAPVGTVNVSTNKWVRLEARCLASTTVGEVEWWLYNTTESTVASDTGLATGKVLLADNDETHFGLTGGSFPTTPYTHEIDTIAVATDVKIGPFVTYDPVPISSRHLTFGPF